MKTQEKTFTTFLMAILMIILGSGTALAAEFEPNQVIGATNWEGTFVYDEQGNDVTASNSGFIGRAKYDAETNRYEFFDKVTNETRGDRGVFFITQDGKKRILMSQSANYNAVVDMVRLDNEKFTYRRDGIQKDNSRGQVYVEHVPYEGQLTFTMAPPSLTTSTGVIDKTRHGRNILSSTFWQGTVAKDQQGNDVSDYNRGYLGLARYDRQSGRYEFFDTEGNSRNDFGYFDVINGNKERTHFSLGRYAATLELTELNDKRFTYQRNGKNVAGDDITITVEHEPYTETLPLEFTFGNEQEGPIVMPPIKTGNDDNINSNAIVEVVSPLFAGTVRFAETANMDASIVFDKLDTKNQPTIIDEKEQGLSKISVVDTRSGALEKNDWSVRVKLSDGPFGNKGFLLNELGIRLQPTTNDNTISINGPVELMNTTEKEVFSVSYQEGNAQDKGITLNPQLTIGNIDNLQTGVYGTNAIWTLTPKV